MIYLELLWSFFQIGLFSFGGGYATLPLIQNQIVDLHHWITMPEFVDIITISQMTPGPIAINSATFVGMQIAGIGGAIVATLGCILPSLIIVLTIAYFYFKYKELSMVKGIVKSLRPAVVALIASAGLSILTLSLWNGKPVTLNLSDLDGLAVGIFITGFIILRKFKTDPILIMLGAGAVSLCTFYLFH